MFGNSTFANMEIKENNVVKEFEQANAITPALDQKPLINIQKPISKSAVETPKIDKETLSEIEKIATEIEADEKKIFGIQKKYFYGALVVAIAAVAIYFINKK